MEKRLAIWLFVLLTSGIALCTAWIAWMLLHGRSEAQAFTNAQLVWGVLRHAAV